MNTCVAIDLGGTNIKAGLVRDGAVVARAEIDSQSPSGLQSKLPDLRELVDGLVVLAAENTAPDVIGVAMPGIVDRRSRRLTAINAKWADAIDVDLVGWADSHWGADLVMDNDAVAALAGEWSSGAGRGADGVVMVTLGTGIGVAAVVDGRLLYGSHGQAAIAGHLTVALDGHRCTCGNVGCAEAEASTSVLPERARADPRFAASPLAGVDPLDYHEVFRLAPVDGLSRDLRDRALQVWGALLVSLVHGYDPELLVIGGGIAAAGTDLFDPLRDYLSRYAWTPWGEVEVVPAALGSDAAILGLATLGLHGQ